MDESVLADDEARLVNNLKRVFIDHPGMILMPNNMKTLLDMIDRLTQTPSAVSQWRTMESAPRDGTLVLVWGDGVTSVSWADAADPHGYWYERKRLPPTHWQPLPKSPPPGRGEGE